MKIDNFLQRLIVVLELSTRKPAGKKRGDFSRCNRFVVAVPLFSACIPTLVLSSAKRTVSVLPIGLFADPILTRGI